MQYFLENFNGVQLPKGRPSDSMNLDAISNIFPFKEGAYDGDRDDRIGHQGQAISHQGILFNPLSADIETDADSLRAKYGTVGRLERQRIRSKVIHFTEARLLGIRSQVAVNNTNHIQVDMNWRQLSPVWYGAENVINEGINSDGESISVVNNGNARVTNPVITFALSPALVATSALTIIVDNRVSLTLTDSFVANDVVIVNSGNWTFTRNGAAITDFSFSTTDHKIREVIDFLPGNNIFSLSATPALAPATDISAGAYSGILGPVIYTNEVFLSTLLSITFNDGWH